MHKELPVVLLIIPNLSPGGAQNVFRQHYDYLSKQYTVYGCVFNWSGTQQLEWPTTIKSLDVPGGSNTWKKLLFFLQRISRLRKLKRQLKVSLSISHLEGADYVNVLSGIGERKILWVHGTKKFDQAIQGWIGHVRKFWFMPWLYKKADRVVTVSKAIAEEMEISYPALKSKLQTVNNGVDWPHIQGLLQGAVRSEYELLCKKYVVIITHCRLALQKNVTGLLKVAHELKNQPQIKWVIIGDGELRNTLVGECKKMGIDYYAEWDKENWNEDSQLFFLGYNPNPFPYLQQASLYVMPSSWEGFPLALCEALACSLPVIATDCYTGPREIIAPGQQVMPKASGPEYAQYGLLMPQITNESLNMWVKEINELGSNKERQAEYRSRASLRAKELSLELSLKRVQEVVDSVI